MASGSSVPLVLVTGASGFVASHVVQQLLRSGEFIVRGSVRNVNNEQKTKPLHELCPEAKYPLQLVQADLLDSESWISAMKDCTFVIHMASPFPPETPKNEDEVIKPAVEGTKNVLQACVNAGCVKRVVLTSSCVAIYVGNQDNGRVSTEEDWSVEEECAPYEKSKLLAEKAAWEFIDNLSDEKKIEMVVINPALVLGPVLHGSTCTSMEIPRRLLQKEMPLLARMHFPLCDVRDVAKAHVKAVTLPNASGNRYTICSGSLWMKDWALILEKEFQPQGYSIPTKNCPKIGLYVASLFDKSVKLMLPYVGKECNLSNEKMIKELEITPIKMEKSIIDMAYSLISQGFVKKTERYRERSTEE